MMNLYDFEWCYLDCRCYIFGGISEWYVQTNNTQSMVESIFLSSEYFVYFCLVAYTLSEEKCYNKSWVVENNSKSQMEDYIYANDRLFKSL